MPRRNEPIWYEAAPDPRNRPSVDMLITKLRKMSNLQNKPEAVQFVINDLLDHYFVQEERRPARLWWIMESAMYKFMSITGKSFPNAEMMVAGGAEPPDMLLATPDGIVMVDHKTEDDPVDPATQRQLLLSSAETKAGVAHVIEQHVYRYASNECNCGRPYPTHAEWAKHVRIRIWRYLEDEFRGD